MAKARNKKSAEPAPISKPEESSRYQRITIAISIFSIIASLIVGILSITNSYAIARLDKEAYAPKLQYFWGQSRTDSIFLQIVNAGETSADNVIVDILYRGPYILSNCRALPPFQDMEQVKPAESWHIDYRLPVIPSSGVFILNCEVYYPYMMAVFDRESMKTFLNRNNQATPEIVPVSGVESLILSDKNDIKEWSPKPTALSDIIASTFIFSSTSKPGLLIGEPPTVSVLHAVSLTEEAYKKIEAKYTIWMDDIVVIPLPLDHTYPYPTPTPMK
jgi:hypothetical protein